jgi:DNA-binding transcriptional ArsR family regulator
MDSNAMQDIPSLDKTIHEPARLAIVATLYALESADFLFLLTQTGLTKGNLSAHLAKLEDAGYVAIEKTFRGKQTHTLAVLTDAGRAAFEIYRSQIRAALE